MVAGLLGGLLLASSARAQVPQIAPGVSVKDGGVTLMVSGHAAPETVDWNNDGKQDLLVGQFTSGKVVLYLNQGTSNNPVFSGGTYVQAGGVDITTAYG